MIALPENPLTARTNALKAALGEPDLGVTVSKGTLQIVRAVKPASGRGYYAVTALTRPIPLADYGRRSAEIVVAKCIPTDLIPT